jgi:FtsP/CotA-like multicopper oxidase with cupredoxin domain
MASEDMMNNSAVSQISRRSMLKLSALAAGAGLLAGRDHEVSAQSIGTGFPTAPFVDELPLAPIKVPVAAEAFGAATSEMPVGGECGRSKFQRFAEFKPVKSYHLRVQRSTHKYHRDMPDNEVWGYDGIFPGPTFVSRYNEPISVRIFNDLPANVVGHGSPEISTHLHNLHSPSESDGFTGDYYSATKAGPTLTAPGAFKDHLYPNCRAGYDKYHATDGDPRESLGTLWYHDHRLDFTAPNVYRGMAGFYLLFDEYDTGNETDPAPAFGLPSGVNVYDIPLAICDRQFDASGNLVFDQFNTDGIIGNKIMVNGKIQPFFKVQRRKYRFRILNASPARQYEFYIVAANKDTPFTYIANDGNLLPAPLKMTKIRMAPAERADIIINFNDYPEGSEVFLVNKLEQVDGRKPTGKILSPGMQVLKFMVATGAAPADPSRIPTKLRDLPDIDLNEVVRTRRWRFDRSGGGWTVNGQLFDVSKPAAQVKKGTAEIWILEGGGNWDHPVHIHFEEGRILSRNGKPPPAHEAGRKDVYVVGGGDEVRVFLRFRDYEGKYMMHCHNSVHEDHAMMVRWDIVP